MARAAPLFDRLAGLETEYAFRFQVGASGVRPPNAQLYRWLVGAVRQTTLTAPAKHFKEGVFLATGGAIWFETLSSADQSGLVEGATPECRGPRRLLAYQRGQDRLLAQAAERCVPAGRCVLLKNDRDSQGNVYGGQENYDAEIGGTCALWFWRVGLVLLLPIVVATWCAGLGAILLFAVTLLLVLLIGTFFGAGAGRPSRGESPLGDFWKSAWFDALLLWLMRAFTAPLALGVWLLSSCCAFRRVRREMTAFLVSRPVIGGAGLVDDQNRFQLADKAPAINCLTGLGGYLMDRPLFNFGHFFKAACVEALFSPSEYADLFARRQRLQIGLGDSNMAETAEYLRVGATMLVLDAIEAGALRGAPRFRRPLRALRAFCADPSLQAAERTASGQRFTALEVQRYYLEGCRAYLRQRQAALAAAPPPAAKTATDVDGHVDEDGRADEEDQVDAEGRADARAALDEAWELLLLWEETLDALERDPESLVGSLDWVTKRRMLEQAGPDASWEQRKKIDLRYHELSPEGYFAQLEDNGMAPRVLEEDEIARAQRVPPPNSPATIRGHYLREFSEGDEGFRVNWKWVILERGGKRVRLSKFGRKPARAKAT